MGKKDPKFAQRKKRDFQEEAPAFFVAHSEAVSVSFLFSVSFFF